MLLPHGHERQLKKQKSTVVENVGMRSVCRPFSAHREHVRRGPATAAATVIPSTLTRVCPQPRHATEMGDSKMVRSRIS